MTGELEFVDWKESVGFLPDFLAIASAFTGRKCLHCWLLRLKDGVRKEGCRRRSLYSLVGILKLLSLKSI